MLRQELMLIAAPAVLVIFIAVTVSGLPSHGAEGSGIPYHLP